MQGRAGLASGGKTRAMFVRRARRGIEAPTMNASFATVLGDGIYIGGGVILAILIIVVLILLLRRGV